MKTTLFLVALALLCGCATDPGHISHSTSKLDGEKQISITPAWLQGKGMSTPARMGGFWSSSAPDVFSLEVVTEDNHPITGLRVRLNDKIHEVKPAAAERHLFPDENNRRFVVPLSLVRELVAAKSSIIQIQQLNTRIEVDFSGEFFTLARPRFRKALAEIDALQKGTAP